MFCITVFGITYLCLEYLLLTRTCLYHKYLEHGQKRNVTWWRHQMETFSAILALCAGNSPVTGEFPHKSDTELWYLCLNKPLGKQSWGWWFETPSRSLWHHCNDSILWDVIIYTFPEYPLLPLNFLYDSLRFLKKTSKLAQHSSRARRNNGTHGILWHVNKGVQQSRNCQGNSSPSKSWGKVEVFKVIHKENSRFLDQFFPTPCLYHELNMIIRTRYINI